jgi:hypothetical protein
MTMTDDLVTEARKGGPCAELGDRCRAIEAASGCFCAAVADRIEALTAERDALIAQRDAVPFDTDALGMGLEMAAQSTIRIVTKERDEALADNARLRKVLECLLIEYDYAELAHAEPPSLTAAVFSARAALNTGKEPSHE